MKRVRVRFSGQVTFNSVNVCLQAALGGFGIAFLPEAAVAPHPASGALHLVLDDWSQLIAGLHLYYPSRRHSPAFRVIIDAVRLQGGKTGWSA